MMSLDNTLWLAGIVTEAAVVGLLVYRRMWRLLPIFCIYCGWDLISNVGSFVSSHYFPNSYNVNTYLAQIAIDFALQFCVLVELAWSVLRPIRQSLPRFAPIAVAALILAAGGVIWPFSAVPGLAQFSPTQQFLGQLQQTGFILRLLFFLVLAGCSQWLSLSLRDRELQVATGLGFYSIICLFVAMLATHQTTGLQFKHLNSITVGGFLCSLLYWVFSFAQKQAERREFTPQMQNMLLAVAGVARADRMALARTSSEDGKARRNP